MFEKMMESNRGGGGGRRGANDGEERQGRGRNSERSSDERGFAAMDPEQQREIARMGGEAVSRNREHMAEIGRKGGEASRGGRRNNRDNDRDSDRGGNQGGGRSGGGGGRE